MSTVACVTFDAFPDLTPDDRLAAAALRAAGIEVEPVLWDADSDWSRFAAVILRSTWDYHHRLDEFRAWLDALDAAGARVLNSTEIIRWNMDKLYLQELQEAGFAVTPSVWLPRGAKASLSDIMSQKGWAQAVVKPTVSASADDTFLVTAENREDRQADFAALLARKAVVVQQFMPELQAEGEWSLMFFNKQYSHAVIKRPGVGDFRVQRQYGGYDEAATAPQTLMAQAQAIVDDIDQDLLYARVDGVAQGDTFVLMELELIEPVLFFGAAEPSAAQFALAVASQLASKEAA
jgi:glutathione synthase/RimK-type ligase-like ATP-grasp enzyme